MHSKLAALWRSIGAAFLVLILHRPAAAETPMGTLFAVGDIAECEPKSTRKFKTGEAIANLVDAEINAARKEADNPDHPVAVLALGDLAYDEGTPNDFNCFDKHWKKLRPVLYPVPGNHEYEKKLENGEASPAGRHHAAPYFDYFSDDPASGDRRFARTVKQHGDDAGYYFVNFPENAAKPWRLIGLNSHAHRADQVTKLQEDLQATREAGLRCVLAFSHAFFYSSGRHGHGLNGLGDYHAKLVPEDIMKGMFRALYKGGASLLVSGHDHHFEQLGRATPDADDEDQGKKAEAPDGVRSFIVGTGGTQLYSLPLRARPDPAHPGHVVMVPGNLYDRRWTFQEAYNLDGYGILRIDLFDGHYTWRFIGEKNQPGTIVTVKPLPENRDECNR